MGNDVFANGREVSCKAADGKSICAFPDVCMTPPENPATPPGVPVPYPNTGMASDTTSGSKKVKISDKEVILKNKSYFKKSTGDEAGCAAKKGVVTSTNRGKVYFNSWSMDVKFEGENVVRHLDLTTHNHMSVPGNSPSWPYLDQMAISLDDPCVADIKKEYEKCKDYEPHKKGGGSPCPPEGKPTKHTADALADKIAADECLAAKRCQLVPYNPSGKQPECCPGQTGHHLVEASSFFNRGRGGKDSKAIAKTEGYNTGKAPCICVEGTSQWHGTHGLMHTYQSTAALNSGKILKKLKLEDGSNASVVATNYGDAKDQGVNAAQKTFPESDCNKDCLKKQLDSYHNQHNINDDTECKSVITGRKGDEAVRAADQAVLDRSNKIVAGRAGAPSAK